ELDVYDTFVWTAVGDDKKIAKVLEKFDEHYEPRKNVTYERYIFFTRAQETCETIDQYVTTLKRLSDTCEFGTLRNTLTKNRIVLGVKNQKIRERLLREPDLTLDKSLDLVRAAERTEMHIKVINDGSAVHGINHKKSKFNERNSQEENSKKSNRTENSLTSEVFNCRNCGTKHKGKECPAYGKTCHRCRKSN
ncbi:Hypothetical predicted protein, partial [Paramuricea clavata]